MENGEEDLLGEEVEKFSLIRPTFCQMNAFFPAVFLFSFLVSLSYFTPNLLQLDR